MVEIVTRVFGPATHPRELDPALLESHLGRADQVALRHSPSLGFLRHGARRRDGHFVEGAGTTLGSSRSTTAAPTPVASTTTVQRPERSSRRLRSAMCSPGSGSSCRGAGARCRCNPGPRHRLFAAQADDCGVVIGLAEVDTEDVGRHAIAPNKGIRSSSRAATTSSDENTLARESTNSHSYFGPELPGSHGGGGVVGGGASCEEFLYQIKIRPKATPESRAATRNSAMLEGRAHWVCSSGPTSNAVFHLHDHGSGATCKTGADTTKGL